MSDITALGALTEARRQGVTVPDDLSIVGFDDFPETRWTQPGLTTVSQATEVKGRIAAQLLLDLIAGESEPEHIPLETKLVVRDSVGPAHSTR